MLGILLKSGIKILSTIPESHPNSDLIAKTIFKKREQKKSS